jgi:3-methyladenine DNA glycosylase AlkC
MSDPVFCTQCGNKSNSDDLFCNKCGAPIRKSGNESAEVSSPKGGVDIFADPEAFSLASKTHSGREIFARNSASENILEVLTKDEDPEIRGYVAENKSASANILSQLALDKANWIRAIVASNLNSPQTVISQLASDPSEQVRGAVAENPNTPQNILSEFLESDLEEIKKGLARNPNTPAATLERLAEDEDMFVRRALAVNPAASIGILAALSTDDEDFVREGVASNPGSPEKVLVFLSKDDESGVRSEVARNTNCPIRVVELLVDDEEEGVRGAVASNPKTPVSLLENLAKDSEPWVRHFAAANPNTPEENLRALGMEDDTLVLSGLAKNPSAALENLEQLADLIDKNIRFDVLTNPGTPAFLKKRIIERFEIYEEVLNKSFKSTDAQSKYLMKLLGQFKPETNKVESAANLRFEIDVSVESGPCSADFQDLFGEDLAKFDTHDELIEYMVEVWDFENYSCIYGGDDAYSNLRQSKPFGDFDEDEEIGSDDSGYWTVESFDRSNGTFLYSWCKDLFGLVVEAPDEVAAKQFTLDNLSRCFYLVDTNAQEESAIEVIRVQSVKKLAN